jgi:hypothetical protein
MILRFLGAEFNRPVSAEGKIKVGRGSGIDFPTKEKLTPTPAATNRQLDGWRPPYLHGSGGQYGIY